MTGLIYEMLFLIPLSIGVFSFLMPYTGLPEAVPEWGVFVISAALALTLCIFKQLKNRWRVVLMGLIVTFALSVFFLNPGEERLDFLLSLLWLYRIILAELLCFLAEELLERMPLMRLIPVLCGWILSCVLLFFYRQPGKTAVLSVLLFTVLTAADLFQRRSRKEGDTGNEKHLVCTSPFILVFFIILIFIKMPERPYDWGIVKRIGTTVRSTCALITEQFFSGDRWSVGDPLLGFSDRGNVGGNLKGTDYAVMNLGSLSESDRWIYLSGRSFDSFDGREWHKTDESSFDERGLDTIETLSAILDEAPDGSFGEMAKSVGLTIAYEGLRTKSTFIPPKVYPYNAGTGKELNAGGGDFSFGSSSAARESYTVRYFRINRDFEPFVELLKNGHVTDEESWNRACENLGGLSGEEYSYSRYLEYKDMLYTTYLTDPEISAEVRAYADSLTEGAETDYERLKSIEAALASMNYNDSPGKLPQSIKNSSDYLDSFLMDKKEGYCSHYATTFVLLARAYGIPARYVQGFRAPMGKALKNEARSYMAHAWPEAYIEGVGWIIFEPTPGYSNEVRWLTDEERFAENRLNTWDPSANHVPAMTGAAETKAEKKSGTEETEEEAGFALKWYQLVIPLGAGAGIVLMILLLDMLAKRRRYARMSERDKCLWQCRRGINVLKRLTKGRQDNETLQEYGKRMRALVPESLLGFIGLYEEMLYGEGEPSAEEREELEESMRELRRYVRKARRIVGKKRGGRSLDSTALRSG
ncbi:MAG: transglutaminase domain-containing protein [Lachnospiraceae bacterium]|nr:transglutaminase domain-containing protein [Lachnospiraceae bacterium]